MLVGAHDGAVNHRIFVVGLGGQVLEEALPYPFLGPAGEPLVRVWRRGRHRLGLRGRRLLFLAAACHWQQQRGLAAVGSRFGARRLARGRLLWLRLGFLREAALQASIRLITLGGSVIARGARSSPLVLASTSSRNAS